MISDDKILFRNYFLGKTELIACNYRTQLMTRIGPVYFLWFQKYSLPTCKLVNFQNAKSTTLKVHNISKYGQFKLHVLTYMNYIDSTCILSNVRKYQINNLQNLVLTNFFFTKTFGSPPLELMVNNNFRSAIFVFLSSHFLE